MRIPTKYSSIEELHLDMAILGKILQVPSQTISEMRETLYQEYERLHPKVTLEDKRYELSRPVSSDYEVTNVQDLVLGVEERLIDLDQESDLDLEILEEEVEVPEETMVLFRYENQVQDDSLEEFLGGDTRMFNGDLSMLGTTKHREDLVLTEEEINRMGATAETWGKDGLEINDAVENEVAFEVDDDEIVFTDEVDEVSACDLDLGDSKEPAEYFENNYEEYNLDLGDSDEESEYFEDLEEGVDLSAYDLDLDDSDEEADYYSDEDYEEEYEDSEEYDEDYEEYDEDEYEESEEYDEGYEEYDEEFEDSEEYDEEFEDSEGYDEDEYGTYEDEEESYEKDFDTDEDEEEYYEEDFDTTSDDLSNYDLDLDDYDEPADYYEDDESEDEDDFDTYEDGDEPYEEDFDTEEDYEEDENEFDEDFSSFSEEEETIEEEVQNEEDEFVNLEDVDDDEDLGFTPEPTKPMYNTYIPKQKVDFGSHPIHEEKREVKPPEPVPIEVPKDIRSFVRMNPRCTMQDVLKHYSKKQLEQEIMMGKIIRKGNILHI